MNFFTRSILLLISTVWLAICAKDLYILGIIEHPEIITEHLTILGQTIVALVILRSGLSAKKDSGF